ncbi:hemagglutinin repeat-containing protein [Stutzerimonas stutzeri]|uniref:hemagglutinin repeat-containing protein n=1 Tax=Stutzerimonas stutzeri TaxID=316 RepID=UPI003DA04872
MDVRSPFFQNVATILVGVMFLNPIVSAAAELTAAAGSGATVGQAGNGVPIVNIATPNGNGLSHNKFKDYNVGQQGLILNNATGRTQNTQLGGIILGNANLNGKAAGLILNEVTGGNASRLQGYTEVAGKSAHVVVANPHGISCDGCGFINTPRVTLSTGTPIIESGRLDRFDVNGGHIGIEGQGLNASNVDQFDLITRSAKINAELHANKLNIIAGRNEVDATTLAATAKAPDGSDQPLLAIDSSALGGMYAGAIRLVGTEAGVGVKLAGDMAASAGDIQIDANGQLTMGRSAAGNDLNVDAQAIELKGDVYAAGTATIQSQSDLANRKSLAAGNSISLNGADVVNEGIIEAGLNRDGSQNASADLLVSGRSVINKGTQIAARTLDIQASEKLDNRSGTLSGANSRIEAGQIDNQQGRLLADQGMKLTAAQLNNQAGLVQSGTSAQIAVTGTVDNSAGDLRAGQQLDISAGTLSNKQQGIVAAQGAANVDVGSLDNRTGLISAKQGLALTATQLDNRDNGLVVSEGALQLSAAELDSSNGGEVSAAGDLHAQFGQLTQVGGRIIGGAAVSLDLQGGMLDNRKGLISGKESVVIADAKSISNQTGEISSSGTIELAGSQIDNSQGGRIIAAGTLGISAGHFDNSQAGLMSGWQGVSLTGGSLDNSAAGTLSSRDGKLSLSLSGAIDNRGEGALVSKGDQQITAGSLDNSDKGIVSSEGGIQLDLAGDLDNQAAGQISAVGDLAIIASTAGNQGGQISSGTSLLLKGTSLDNSAGQVSSAGALTLGLTGALLNSNEGQITSAGPLVLTADKIVNQNGRLFSEGLLNLFANSFDNSNGGTLGAGGTLTAKINGALDNSQDGLIFSQNDKLIISAGSLINNSGTLQSATDLLVTTTADMSNQAGKLIANQGNLDIQAASLDNSAGGLLNSIAGWLKIATAGLFDNSSGTTQGQALDIESGQLANIAGHVSALAGDTAITTGSLNNRNGGLYAHDSLIVDANGLNNDGGKIGASLIDFSLAGALTNTSGLVESKSQLTLFAASIDNSNGKLRGLGQSGTTVLTTTSGEFDNRNGLLETANTDLSLDVAGLLNDGGTVQHVGTGTLGIASARATQAGGSLITNGLLDISAASWTHSGLVQANRLHLNVGTFTQTSSGRLLATSALSASGGDWINHGLIASDGTLDLDLAGGYSGNGQLSSLGDMSLQAANVTLDSNSHITGGGATDITVTGLVSNHGRLTSAGDFSLRSATLNNYGTLGGAQGLTIRAATLRNESGLIFSGEDMTLRGSDLLNLRGDIYSLGGLAFAATDNGALAQGFRNLSGTVESGGEMNIAARSLVNARETLDITTYKQAARLVHVGCTDCSGTNEDALFRLDELERTEASNISPQAQMLAGKSMRLVSNELENRYSLIASGGDLTVDTSRFTNLGAQTGEVTASRVLKSYRVKARRVRNQIADAEAFTARNWNTSPSYRPGDINADLNTFINTHIERVHSTSEPVVQNVQYFHGIVQATGKVTINASEQLNNSLVRPSYSYVNGGERVADTKAPGTNIATTVTLNSQLPPDLQQKQVNPLTLPGFTLPQGEHGLFRLSDQSSQNASASASAGTVSPQQIGGVQGLPSAGRPAGAHKYLIETNPALTDLKQFMSSDYLLGNLGYDTDATQKRLGDGLYEQRLIREAIVARTGQRYLAGLTSDEAMFRHLMDNAIASKDALGLSLGISLTAEQVAALTHDIVWMEEHEVMGETVLVPVLYLAQAEGRLAPTGALIQGRDVALISGGALNNQGTLRASQNLKVTAGNISNGGLMQASERLQLLATDSIRNTAGGIIAGRDVSAVALTGDIINERSVTTHQAADGARYQNREDFVDSAARIEASHDLTLSAGRDLLNRGGVLQAGGDARLVAERDVEIGAAFETDFSLQRKGKGASRVEQTAVHGSEVAVQGDLTIAAGRDATIAASQVDVGSNLTLVAERDVVVRSEASESAYLYQSSRRKSEGSDTVQIGSVITIGGDALLAARNDLRVSASTVSSEDGALTLQAGNDLTIDATDNEHFESRYRKKTKSGALSSSTKVTYDASGYTEAQGSLISGNTTVLQAGNDLTVRGSDIVSTEQTTLRAGNDIRIVSATETSTSEHLEQRKKSGLMSSGGIGVTLGSTATKSNSTNATETSRASTVGSVLGNVDIRASKDLGVVGSDIVAGRDIRLVGQNVTIEAAENQSRSEQRFESKQSGLTLALSGPVGSAVNTAYQTAQSARKEDDGRLAALQGVKAGLSGYQAMQAVEAGGGADAANAGQFVGVSLSLGSQKSSSQQVHEQSVSQGSNVTAGRNLNIVATGGEGGGGDIIVKGSALQAAGDMGLAAARDVQLLAAQNTQQLKGSNKSSGGAVGVSLGYSTEGSAGLSIFANANKGSGQEKGNGTTWTETTLDAGGKVSLVSGQDTVLRGAQVSGDQIVADVGRDLRLQSLQDSDRYNSKQTDVSGGVSFTYGTMSGSGSISVSQSKLKSDFNSVQEQTGLFAGKGGYQLDVQGHTQLDGSVIASTADPEANRLETGTLGWTDIRNKAEFSAQQQSAGFSSGGSIGDQFKGNMANALLVGANRSESESSTTHSAISQGALVIRNEAEQQQDVATLSRDVEHANNALSPIFDKEKEQRRLREVQLIAEIGNQTMDIIRTHGQIEASKAAREEFAKAGNFSPSAEEIAGSDAYKKKMAEYGTGSDLQRAAQAVTAALQGLAGGNVAGAVGGAAAPYLAQTIKQVAGDNEAARLMAHAVLGAVVAQSQGNSAAAGGLGALTAEVAADLIAKQLYEVTDVSKLTEEQKQTVSALATLAGGLAGAVGGSGAADAVAGAQGGKNAVENNEFGLPIGMVHFGQAATTLAEDLQAKGATPETISLTLQGLARGDGYDGPNPVMDLLKTGGVLVPVGAGLVLSAPVTIGTVAVGAVVSGGVEYYYQYDVKTGDVDLISVGKATVIGGLTQGKSLPVTVMTNVGGEYIYRRIKDDDVGASLVGSAIGTAAGSKLADTAENIGGNSLRTTKSVLATILGSVVSKEVESKVEPIVGGRQ